MSLSRTIRWFIGASLALSVSLCWSLSHAGAIGNERSEVGPALSTTLPFSDPLATETTARQMPPADMPVETTLTLRTLPTLSKQILLGGTTFVPYIGAGFSGGFATEWDRSLNAASSLSSSLFNSGLKSFSQGVIPNEVQLGIRLPF